MSVRIQGREVVDPTAQEKARGRSVMRGVSRHL
jgi:hypothetical protein